MKCDDFQPWISIYVDEALSDMQTVELFSHLSGCPECRGFMRSTLDIRNVIAAAPKPRAPFPDSGFAFASADLRNRGLRATSRLRRSLWSRNVSLPISAAATAAIVLLASLVGLASLWIQTGNRDQSQREQALYMARMPVVEVYAPRAAHAMKPQ